MMRKIPLYWFNQTVSTQRSVVSQDSGGGPIVTYAFYLMGIPARVNMHGGSEIQHGERMTSADNVKIFVDGSLDVVNTDRIYFGTSVYDLHNVNDPDSQNVFLNIDAVLVQPQPAVVIPQLITAGGSNRPECDLTFDNPIFGSAVLASFQIQGIVGTAIDNTGAGTQFHLSGTNWPDDTSGLSWSIGTPLNQSGVLG